MKLFFVSAGRCGTRRIYEIMHAYLPGTYRVVHQMRLSRLANVGGNIFMCLGGGEVFKRFLFRLTVGRYDDRRFFLSSDPLTAMVLPRDVIRSTDVCIVHVVRDDAGFSESMLRLTRSRVKSFIAHNFIPCWQPGIWPFQNLLSPRRRDLYRRVNQKKNAWFEAMYSENPNYMRIDMSDLFQPHFLEGLVQRFFGCRVRIPESELNVKSNATTLSPNL